MKKKIIYSDKVIKPVGPYSQAISVSPNGSEGEPGLIFISGLVGIDPNTGVIPNDVAEQTNIILKSMESILEAANSSMDNVLKTTIFLTNLEDYQTVNNIYASFFSHYPARATVVVSKLVKPELTVEIEAIAHK
uniref:Putative endoribonuclease L-PSP n=1 Tax=uncultured marine microorganism HF4000_APKG10H11 TaxID=455559 RepID=B3TC48_9ZZZZ|nr:putative endoribonuclease L-PSP [uncultured marine microorganism HF4000_APKG10H11]